jgi:flagellar basal-body rod modification protein FlgD
MAIDALASPVSTPAASSSNGLLDNDPKAAQDKFLKLLVTQLKNQDPLQPLDNAQVTSQVAQLNTVTGIQDLNRAMESIGKSLGSSQVVQSTGLLGKTVLSEGNALSFDGKPAAFGIDLSGSADTVNIKISNSFGQVVSTQSLTGLPAGLQTIEWDGQTTEGGLAKNGDYTFTVEATANGKKISTVAYQPSVVRSLENLGADGIKITSQNGKTLSLADVKRVF